MEPRFRWKAVVLMTFWKVCKGTTLQASTQLCPLSFKWPGRRDFALTWTTGPGQLREELLLHQGLLESTDASFHFALLGLDCFEQRLFGFTASVSLAVSQLSTGPVPAFVINFALTSALTVNFLLRPTSTFRDGCIILFSLG